MKVMFALAERDGYPVPENSPELVAVVDEGTQDDNPYAYWRDVERARGALDQVRHFVVDVPDETIRAAFVPTVVVAADEIDVEWTETDFDALCRVCPEADLARRVVPQEVRDRMPDPHDVPLFGAES